MQMNIRLMDHIDPDGLLPAERDVTALTQRYHRALERAICDVPEQYWWVHRRWKGPPPATVMRNRVAAA
jgi:KDO2-lipid IV(A) lauroyltransferase